MLNSFENIFEQLQCSSPKAYLDTLSSSCLRYLFWSLTNPRSLRLSNSSQNSHGIFLATFINAFFHDSLRCALSSFYMLAHYCLTTCLFLFLSSFSLFYFFFLHVPLPFPHSPILFLFDFLFVQPCIYLSVCSVHVLSVCVYVRRAALNNMHYGREWMEL